MGNIQTGDKQLKTGKSPAKGKNFIKNLNRKSPSTKKRGRKKSDAKPEIVDRTPDSEVAIESSDSDAIVFKTYGTVGEREERSRQWSEVTGAARSPTRDEGLAGEAATPGDRSAASESVFTDPSTPLAVELNLAYYSAESDSANGSDMPQQDKSEKVKLDNDSDTCDRSDDVMGGLFSKPSLGIKLERNTHECSHEFRENRVKPSPGATSFTVTKHRKVELPPTTVIEPAILDVALAEKSEKEKRHSSLSEAPIPESNVLRKVASLTLEKVNEAKVTRPKFVPEKLDFQLYEKFEGQMLLNWFLSSTENSHLKSLLSPQDLRNLGIQYCTHLLAAGVLRQISDKDAPTEGIFRPNLMYYWAHTEAPMSQPLTPGRLPMSKWPPDRDSHHLLMQEPSMGYNIIENKKYDNGNNNEEINDLNQAKTIISQLRSKLTQLEIELEKIRLTTQIDALSKNIEDFNNDREKLELISKETQTSTVSNDLDKTNEPVIVKTDGPILRPDVNNELVISSVIKNTNKIDTDTSGHVDSETNCRSDNVENYCKLNKSIDTNNIIDRDIEFDDKDIEIETNDEQGPEKIALSKDNTESAGTIYSSSELSFKSSRMSNDLNSEHESSKEIAPKDTGMYKNSPTVILHISTITGEFPNSNFLEPSTRLSASQGKTDIFKDVKTEAKEMESFTTPEESSISANNSMEPRLQNRTGECLPIKTEDSNFAPPPPPPPPETEEDLCSSDPSIPLSSPTSGKGPPPPPPMPDLGPPPPPMPDLVPTPPPIPNMGPPPPPMPGIGPPPPPPMPGMGPPPPPMPGMGPPPPPMPGMGPPPPPMPCMGPPPPPMPCMGPPPPPMPGMGPPPPPMPGMGPPPPPMPGMGPPPPPMPGMGPPPPPMAGLAAAAPEAGPLPPPLLGGVPPPPPAAGPVPFPAPPVGGWNLQRATLRKTPIKPAAPMKPLYWTRILAAPTPSCQGEAEPSTKPLWLEIDEAKLDNIDEFTELFSRQVVKAPPKKKVEVAVKVKPAKILDSKRSQNVGILAQSLHVEFSEIENAIYNFDTSVVSLEALQQIYELRATDEELSLIREHLRSKPSVPLDRPESFLLDLASIPNFAERISCFMFQAEFEDAASTAMHKLDNLKHTCEFLLKSEPLKKVFAIILTLGNYMNGGNGQRGQADGFGLEILSKLRDVKSKESNITLLHFIVRTWMRGAGGAGAALPVPEPGDVARAAATDFADVASALHALEKQLDACKEETKRVLESDAKLEDAASSGDSQKRLEVFREKMTTFLNSAQEKLTSEKENLEECRNKFIMTVKFYQYRPKCGKVEDCEPKEFFSLWTPFCTDFKDIFKKEEQLAIKERLKEAKKQQGERKSLTQPKKEGGLKARLQKLSNTRK